MESEDENHITKSALEFYARICNQNDHPKLAQKCRDMASKIKCNPNEKCVHNIMVQ